MSMGMCLKLDMRLALACSVCKRYMFTGAPDCFDVNMFGAVKYAWCPICGRPVSKDRWNSAYKRRWSLFMGKRAREAQAKKAQDAAEAVCGFCCVYVEDDDGVLAWRPHDVHSVEEAEYATCAEAQAACDRLNVCADAE